MNSNRKFDVSLDGTILSYTTNQNAFVLTLALFVQSGQWKRENSNFWLPFLMYGTSMLSLLNPLNSVEISMVRTILKRSWILVVVLKSPWITKGTVYFFIRSWSPWNSLPCLKIFLCMSKIFLLILYFKWYFSSSDAIASHTQSFCKSCTVAESSIL